MTKSESTKPETTHEDEDSAAVSSPQRRRRPPRRAIRRRSPVDYDRHAEGRHSIFNEIAGRRPATDDRMMIIDDDPAAAEEPGDSDTFLREQRPPHYGGD